MHVVKQLYDNKIGVGDPLLLSRHVFCFLLRQLGVPPHIHQLKGYFQTKCVFFI